MGAADLRCLAERLLNHLQQAYWRRNGRAITPLVAKWLAWALAAERTAEEARS
jgi:hypothetical protein